MILKFTILQAALSLLSMVKKENLSHGLRMESLDGILLLKTRNITITSTTIKMLQREVWMRKSTDLFLVTCHHLTLE
jgi:hypothetical protein